MNVDQVLSPANLSSLNCTGYYPLNNDVRDYSGNNNHGTSYHSGYTKQKDGKYSAYLDGDDDYIVIPSDVLDTSSFSILFWEYVTTASGTTGYFLGDSTDPTNLFVRMSANTVGTIDAGIGDVQSSSSTTPPDILDKWNMVLVNANSDGTIAVHVNGIEYETGTGSNFAGLTSDLWLGNRSGLDRDLTGYLKNLFIFNGTVLSEQQEHEFYNATYIE